MKCAACGSLNIQDAKDRHFGTIAQLCRAETVSLQRRDVSTIGKKLLSSNISPTCPYNMVNFGQLAAEIVSIVWGTPGNFNGYSRLGSVTARHSNGVSTKLGGVEQRATPIFGRAAITLGIGPHF